jgi:hypothetical protein
MSSRKFEISVVYAISRAVFAYGGGKATAKTAAVNT